jgi:hypothetical protein
MQLARPERFCFATAQQGSPRSAVGDPVGAVADALRCRESATSNLAAARLSTSRRRREFSSHPGEASETKKGPLRGTLFRFTGAPGEIRTPDLLVRSQTLYPTELRARKPTRIVLAEREGFEPSKGF